MAGHIDRARECMSCHRGPTSAGCRIMLRQLRPGRNGGRPAGRCGKSNRLSTRPARGGRPGREGGDRALGQHPTRARHHDVSDRIVTGGAGSLGVCVATTGGRHLCRWTLPGSGHGRRSGRAGHRPERGSGDADRGQPGAVRRNPPGWFQAPADVSGYGPIPAAVARDLVSGAVNDERSRATLRRYMRIRPPALWWPWSPEPGCFPGAWRPSSGSGISVAARRTATRRSAISTMLGHGQPAGRPMRTTGSDCVNAVITSKKSPAGSLRPQVDENARHAAKFTTPTGTAYRFGGASASGISCTDGDQRNGSRRRDSDLRLTRRIGGRWPAAFGNEYGVSADELAGRPRLGLS